MKIALALSSNRSSTCPFCEEHLRLDISEDLTAAARHLQEEHALKCIHVGTETIHDQDGRPWHTTIAVFGAVRLPKRIEQPVRRFVVDL